MKVVVSAVLAAVGFGALPAAAGEDEPPDRPSGTLVVVHRSENRLTSIDVSTGASRTLRAPWLARCASAPYVIDGRLVVAGQDRRWRGVTYTLGLDLTGRRRLARSWLSHPSATPGRVWTVDEPASRSDERSAREITVDGRQTLRGRPLPELYLAGAVTEGLLFERRGHLLVWDPASGRVRRRLPGAFVIGTHGSLVASCGTGECRRGVQLSDAGTGRRTVLRAPLSVRLTPQGAFSPDGRHVAVSATTNGGRGIVVMDVVTGEASIVPGARLHRWYPSLTWSPSGEWLFWNAGRGAAMAYRPGSAAAVTLPFRIPRAIALAAG